jgi:predicted unusual protein kinase regulating ubiquinone biosynthesis (AarF/ABC1/UbiB family)
MSGPEPQVDRNAAPGSDRPPADAGVTEPDVDERWVRLRAAWRLVVVLYRFAPLVVTYLRDRNRFLLFGRSREVTGEAQLERARRLLDILVALGPTFIKIGQILSTRPDVLPGPYIAVLQQLQDRVPPADWESVRPVLEDELGPVGEAFDAFDRPPISGASLGQVYTAELDGETVAVKVLRPNIRRRVEADLRVIDVLVPVLLRGAEPGQAFTLENLADEFTATLREEMDYVHEARMLRTVRENFADDPMIRIPRTIDSHCGETVLTMEYVGGTKITDVERLDERGIDRQALVSRLQEAYIQMVLEDGVFHADPHPGNLAVRDDGTLVFYDFGITGSIDEQLQDQIFEFYVAIARNDIDGVIDSFIAMGALDPTANRRLMREMFEIVLDSFRGKDVDEYQVQQLVAEFQAELYEFPLRLPQNLALIVRVTTVLEGVARTLDPEFDLIEVISDYVRSEGYAEAGLRQLLSEAGAELQSFSRALVTGAPRAERVLDRFERDDVTVQTALGDEDGYFDLMAKVAVVGLGAVAFVFASLVLFLGGERPEAVVTAAGALLSFGLLWWTLRERSGIRAQPQFTRQEMRKRQQAADRETEGGYAQSFGNPDDGGDG